MDCLITCVNYDDLLNLSLPSVTRALGFPPLVVTSYSDYNTQNVVLYHRARIHCTEAFYKDGAAFNKAAALNEAIGSGKFDVSKWVLLLDADIVLPKKMGEVINAEATDKSCLYGAYRLACPDYATYLAGGPFPMGPIPKHELPGFFHLFWAPRIKHPWYDDTYEHAGGYDSIFQKQWDKQHKRRISVPVTHLGPLGENWHGRRTTRWCDGVFTGRPEKHRIERAHKRHDDLRAKRVKAEGRKEAKL